jgi:3-deoxy-D-manno-octulosonate 8-phosphate phosphatase (KDO 8-P phosphatase)
MHRRRTSDPGVTQIAAENVDSKFADIKAIALDVDGVLTDGRFWWNAAGDEWKCFSFADVMGLSRAKRAGIIVTLISGENSPLVDRFAVKLEISDYTKGCKDKAEALRGFVARHDLAGCSAAPADARPAVLAIAQVVSRFGGGNGAVREIVDLIISSKESTNRNG